MKRIIDSTRKIQPLAPRARQRRGHQATPPGEAGIPTLAELAAPLAALRRATERSPNVFNKSEKGLPIVTRQSFF